jgi:hypothetical protein
MIQDYFDDNYIFCIDPKPDYGKMCTLLAGENIVLGKKSKDKDHRALNIWDVLTVPNDVNVSGDEVALPALDKTYIKNDAVFAALFNIKDKTDGDELIAA